MGTTSRLYVRALAAALALAPRTAAADTPGPTSSPAPSPAPYVSIEEEASPNYDGERGSSTQLNVSGQVPLGNGYVFRLKYPFVTSAPSQSVTGAGDLSLYDLRVLNSAGGQWLAGITLRLPTAEDSSLGSGKYSIGPALGYRIVSGRWTLGFFTQDYFSVIGPSSRAPVGKTKIEPVAILALPGEWSVGLSSMSMTYDWVLNRWTEVPVGVAIGKRFGRAGLLPGLYPVEVLRPLQASFEAEQNISNVRAAPGWTTRLSLRWTF